MKLKQVDIKKLNFDDFAKQINQNSYYLAKFCDYWIVGKWEINHDNAYDWMFDCSGIIYLGSTDMSKLTDKMRFLYEICDNELTIEDAKNLLINENSELRKILKEKERDRKIKISLL